MRRKGSEARVKKTRFKVSVSRLKAKGLVLYESIFIEFERIERKVYCS